MNKDFEIAVTLNTDEANEKLEQLTAKAQGLAELFTSIAEQADRATKIMPPSTVVDAVYAMRHGCRTMNQCYGTATPAQAAAVEAGIKYGWSDRRANPALYDADGAFCG